jgi:hypothetical protein
MKEMKYLTILLVFLSSTVSAEDHPEIQFTNKNQPVALKEFNLKSSQNKLTFYNLEEGDINKDGISDFLVLAEVDEGQFSIFVFLGKSDSTYSFYKQSGALALDTRGIQQVKIQRRSIFFSRYAQSM